MNEFYNRHFIKTDDRGRILAGWSDGPQQGRDTTDAVCISDKGGYQFRLFLNGEENPPLHGTNGIPLYKWDGGQVQPRTEEEIAADHAAIPAPSPTETERLRAELEQLRQELTDTQMALCDAYELMLGAADA